ncbi:MAG: hypothetical protein ACKO01_04075, partial [Erythrobacter sp.]
MSGLHISSDTAPFEVAAVTGADGRLADSCAQEALAIMARHGFVILTGLLSDAEADAGLGLVRAALDGPALALCAFASQTYHRHLLRYSCSLPPIPPSPASPPPPPP